MRKTALTFALVAFCSVNGFAWIINHELRPQYRVWKSSHLDSGDYAGTQISTSPIIFHALVGSGTINNSGNSVFTLMQDTGMTVMSAVPSTKAIIPLDSTNPNSVFGEPLDILITTHSYFNKVGPARVQFLWDYLDGGVQYNRFPRE